MARQRLYFWLCVAIAALCLPVWCQLPAPPVPGAGDSRTSPVDYFRKLLAMKPDEREAALTGRSAEQKRILVAKLHEYEQMPPEVRELRLRYTQLRWHMLDLMKLAPGDRLSRLAQVSAADRPMIEERLRRWDGLAPDVRAAFLQNEGAVAMYIERQANPPELPPSPSPSLVPSRQRRLDEQLTHWQALPSRQKQEMCDLFREFFDLGDKEKQQTLRKLPAPQRQLTEEAVQALAKLPHDQREKRLESLRKLVNMSASDQQRFMESAARWELMAPDEREAWRKSVSKLPPMPPLPPGLAEKMPPIPPLPPGFSPVPSPVSSTQSVSR